MPQNFPIGHRILPREPYLVLGSQIAHPCTTTFSFAILIVSGMCDDLKFTLSGQRPETIFNNRVGYSIIQLVLFCHRLKIKWETFIDVETTSQFNKNLF